jgi:ABC-type glycerol-3-phosphate transport system permease component
MGERGAMIRTVDRFLRPYNLTVRQVPIWLAGLFIALLWASPFIWMVSTSLKPASQVMTRDIEWLPRTVVLENYARVFEHPVLRWALNSVIVSASSTALCVVSGAMAGYALARMRFPGRDLIFAVFLVSLMVPTEVYVVPLLLAIIKIGWASSYQALILPTVANIFDEEMKTLPVGIAVFAPVVGSHTQLEGFAVAMAAATLLSLPSLLLFFAMQRYFVQGIATSGLKG